MRTRITMICMLVVLMGVTVCGCRQAVVQTDKKELPELVVGCDNYSPFSYADANGEMTGIDVELAREAFARIGYAPKFVFINWEEKKELLAEGKLDCIWSSFTMTGREDEYNWAGPYMRSRQVAAVKEDSDIRTLQDLEDKIVVVQNTTKPEDIIRSHDGTLPQLRKVISVQKRDLIFILVGKGYADALAAHDTSVDQFMSDTGLRFRMLDEPLQTVELGVAFDKNDTRDIYTKIDETLEEMRADGTTRRIVGEYLQNADNYLEGENAED